MHSRKLSLVSHDSNFSFSRSVFPSTLEARTGLFRLEGMFRFLWDRKIIPTLFAKALGPSKSKCLPYPCPVCDTTSFSAGHGRSWNGQNTEHRFCQYFFLLKGRLLLSLNYEIKDKGHRTCFCGRAAESAHHLTGIPWDFWVKTGTRFKTACNSLQVEGGRKHWKIRFYGIYIGISQLGRNMIKIKLKFHLKWFSTTCTIEASVRNLNSATRVTDTFQHFATHMHLG